MKKANMICAARKSVTSNPFIIFDFYEPARIVNTVSSTPASSSKCFCGELGPKPQVNLDGYEWFPTWQLRLLQEQTPTASNASTKPVDTSFEELVLNKMKGNVENPVVKRRKIDCKAKIITDGEYLQ